jgi:DNA mismatch endonuclease (patch repair protein)
MSTGCGCRAVKHRLRFAASSAVGVMDRLTSNERSRQMALIHSKNTKPELLVRKIARSLGHRFRLHVADLPGKPDLVFPNSKAIFVHGCFWHGHTCRRGRNKPNSNLDYWQAKLNKNLRRDRAHRRRLRKMGWKVLVVWECRLKNLDQVHSRIKKFVEA